jgi:hypothetical protein
MIKNIEKLNVVITKCELHWNLNYYFISSKRSIFRLIG